MSRSMRNKLSVAAAIVSVILEARGKRKWAIGVSLLAAALQLEPRSTTPQVTQYPLRDLEEPRVDEGEQMRSSDISSTLHSSRLIH